MRDISGVIKPCQCLDFVEVSLRHRIYPLIYCNMELSSPLDVDCLKRSVALSSKIVPEILCAYSFQQNGFINLGYTSDDVIRYNTKPTASFLQVDLAKAPQLQIFIYSQSNRNLATIVMSHILSDGAGFLEYLYLLASFYNGKNPNVCNMREISPILKKIHIGQQTKQSRNKKPQNIQPLRQYSDGKQLFSLRSIIPQVNLEKIKAMVKLQHATLNDAFLAAYARVIACRQNAISVALSCPADLRRFCPRQEYLTVANMTGMYQKILVDIPHEVSFSRTLAQVNSEMALQKEQCRCFSKIPLLNWSYPKVPRYFMERAIQAYCHINPISFSNIGTIDHHKLSFNNCQVTDCFLTGTYRLPPDFQLTVSTFRGVCTLNCTFVGEAGENVIAQEILDQVKQELLEWIEN